MLHYMRCEEAPAVTLSDERTMESDTEAVEQGKGKGNINGCTITVTEQMKQKVNHTYPYEC